MNTDSPTPESEPEPERESKDEGKPELKPQNHRPSDPFDAPYGVTTCCYDGQGRLIEIQAPSEHGGHTVYSYDLPPACLFEWKHLPDKRLYALTAEGKTEFWRDNPTRYLVVERDEETGGIKPAVKGRRPVYLWLCREEREGRRSRGSSEEDSRH
jgi:hypothetical protein